MKTIQVSPEEMEKRVVRFKKQIPRSQILQQRTSVPAEVNEFFSADVNYTYMAPQLPNNSTITSTAAITGGDAGDAISVSLAFCKPGGGPQLHAHMHTVEAFFCLKGRFDITWGDKGEHKLTLDPYDFIPVPPGVLRTFTNVSDEDGALLVIIQGDKQKFRDVQFSPDMADYVQQRWGADILSKLEASGRVFKAGVAE
jgi:uncharacterized RmlC-like cupin family protein